jgi:hypothetical protein
VRGPGQGKVSKWRGAERKRRTNFDRGWWWNVVEGLIGGKWFKNKNDGKQARRKTKE